MAYAAFPPRHAAPGWPLLATLGVHLLLAWSWRIAHPPAPEPGGERVIELVPVPPAALPTPPARRQPPVLHAAPPAAPRARAGKAPADIVAEPEPMTAPAQAPPAAADPFSVPVPQAAAPSTLDAMLGRARRDAVLIDRELRKGKSGLPEVADTPSGRFTQALAGAYKERGLGVSSETYTAPDGQVIYRFRRGGKIKCRSGGSVGPKIGGAVGGGEVLFDVQGGAGRAGEVPCPSHTDWKRD